MSTPLYNLFMVALGQNGLFPSRRKKMKQIAKKIQLSLVMHGEWFKLGKIDEAINLRRIERKIRV